jgi:uncharacterized protein DUF6265
MKRLTCGLAVTTFLASGAHASAAGVIDRVGWLQGCWQMAAGNRLVEEQWTAPGGGIMLGVGRTTRDGSLVEYELVALTEKDGQLAYEAHPSGQESAVFASREIGEGKVVFENLGHDFPQRVGYEQRGSDALLAWVEGTANGRARRIEFAYRRTPCP